MINAHLTHFFTLYSISKSATTRLSGVSLDPQVLKTHIIVVLAEELQPGDLAFHGIPFTHLIVVLQTGERRVFEADIDADHAVAQRELKEWK